MKYFCRGDSSSMNYKLYKRIVGDYSHSFCSRYEIQINSWMIFQSSPDCEHGYRNILGPSISLGIKYL